jgi:hypothetical protein
VLIRDGCPYLNLDGLSLPLNVILSNSARLKTSQKEFNLKYIYMDKKVKITL